MSTKGGPVFTFGLSGGAVRHLAPLLVTPLSTMRESLSLESKLF